MIIECLKLSLVMTAIFVAVQPGNILEIPTAFISTCLDMVFKKRPAISVYIVKPLWGCLPCMGSVWVTILTRHFDLQQILIVVGINCIIDKFLDYD